MADLNARQNGFITRTKELEKLMRKVHAEAFEIGQSYAEEFSTGQDNDLANADNLEGTYDFDASDVAAAINQTVDNYVNFWVGNAVVTREYGKDMRRIG